MNNYNLKDLFFPFLKAGSEVKVTIRVFAKTFEGGVFIISFYLTGKFHTLVEYNIYLFIYTTSL